MAPRKLPGWQPPDAHTLLVYHRRRGLVRIRCPFWVQSRFETLTFERNEWARVTAIRTGHGERLYYWIRGRLYLHSPFRIRL